MNFIRNDATKFRTNSTERHENDAQSVPISKRQKPKPPPREPISIRLLPSKLAEFRREAKAANMHLASYVYSITVDAHERQKSLQGDNANLRSKIEELEQRLKKQIEFNQQQSQVLNDCQEQNQSLQFDLTNLQQQTVSSNNTYYELRESSKMEIQKLRHNLDKTDDLFRVADSYVNFLKEKFPEFSKKQLLEAALMNATYGLKHKFGLIIQYRKTLFNNFKPNKNDRNSTH